MFCSSEEHSKVHSISTAPMEHQEESEALSTSLNQAPNQEIGQGELEQTLQKHTVIQGLSLYPHIMPSMDISLWSAFPGPAMASIPPRQV